MTPVSASPLEAFCSGFVNCPCLFLMKQPMEEVHLKTTCHQGWHKPHAGGPRLYSLEDPPWPWLRKPQVPGIRSCILKLQHFLLLNWLSHVFCHNIGHLRHIFINWLDNNGSILIFSTFLLINHDYAFAVLFSIKSLRKSVLQGKLFMYE